MKNLYKILLSLFVIAGVYSCSDDADISYVVQEPAPTFTIEAPLGGSTIVLDDTNGDNTALTIVWEDTQTGGAGTYTIQFALAETDFATPTVVGTSDVTNADWTVTELNTIFLEEMQISQGEESAIEVRILASNEEVSNTITLIVTPYVIEVTELFVNGNFTGWDPALGIALTMTDFNIFNVTIDLVDGDEFNFIDNNETWQLVEAGSMNLTRFGGPNLSGYATGKYEFTVNLSTNTFTVEQITFPEALFLVGAAVPDAGWGWDSPVEMILTGEDVFEVTTSLVNDAFRFFTVDGDWGSGLNYPYFIADGYTIDSNFENALDDDNNFSFIGTPGIYTIKVDGNSKTITATEIVQSSRIAVPGNHQGWDPGSAPQLEASSTSSTDYEGYVWLDGTHKFVGPDANGDFAWGNTDWGDDGSFTGLLLADGESDCTATAGHYFITADTNALTYTETQYSWGLIGDATPDGWNSDQDMTFDAATSTWTITLDLVAGLMKFRANDDWPWNYGDNGADGSLELDGDNLVVAADGNYTVVLDLSTPRAYTYSVTLN